MHNIRDCAIIKSHMSVHDGHHRPSLEGPTMEGTPLAFCEQVFIAHLFLKIHINNSQVCVKSLSDMPFVLNREYLCRILADRRCGRSPGQ